MGTNLTYALSTISKICCHGPKSITYGIYNGTQVAQMTYNAQMLPAHYELAGQASVNYGYSFDGHLNQVIGLAVFPWILYRPSHLRASAHM